MSILGRLIKEDLRSVWALRKAARALRAPPAGGFDRTEPASERSISPGSAPVRGGMKVVVLNWSGGENDPFTVTNEAIRRHLVGCGKIVEVLQIADRNWPARLAQLAQDGVEFAYTWQGLGSAVTVGPDNASLWDHLRIPLLCVHGDHPSHMPSNHALESRHCFHTYTNAEFARYSNRHFRYRRDARIIDIPRLHNDPPITRREGDFFVFAKNITHPDDWQELWRQQRTQEESRTYMLAAEVVRSKIVSEPYTDVHALLDDVLLREGIAWLSRETDRATYHRFHSQLDHFSRCLKSVLAVSELHEFPLRIYGRGWERVARNAPKRHEFFQGLDMARSQMLYSSRYGIVDISPSQGLHDRARRAMVNRAGFLSNASLEDWFADLAPFESLFFTLQPGRLAARCEAVIADPDAHRMVAANFGRAYDQQFPFRRFVAELDTLAKTVERF